MLIQGERVKHIEVKKIIEKIFTGEHAKRQESLANGALGVIAGGSLIVHRIGLSLASANNLIGKHAVKQVDRLLSNPKLEVERSFINYVPYVVGGRKEIITAMDWTIFDGDKQATLCIQLVTNHGRATPLVWKTVDMKELKDKQNVYEYELLKVLKKTVPEGVKVTVLADRGFGKVKLYNFMNDTVGFNFIIRFRGNIKVTDQHGEERKAEGWVRKNGRACRLKQAKVTGQGYEVPLLVCVKHKGMKQAWCIAASNPDLSASELIRWYAKRWGIEAQFRDTKDLHFGMGLSETSISKPERRDRLLLISALAVLILTVLGAAGEKLGLDRWLKVNTVNYRTHSLFRQGCYYYNKLPTMKEPERTALITSFSALLAEHHFFQQLLSVI